MNKLTGLLCGLAVAALAAPTLAKEPIDYSNTLVVVACEVEDWTGKREPKGPNGEPQLPAPGWKDLELKLNKFGEVSCKREVVNQFDLPKGLFADVRTRIGCVRAGPLVAQQWNEEPGHEGWAVAAIGCPTPIFNDMNYNQELDPDEEILDWKLPECPTWLKCNYTENEV